MARPRPTGQPPPDEEPGRLRGADAFRLHLTLALGLALCISAFVFEVIRALGGNTLSWAYVFEWPIFAAFAIYMWWNLLHGRHGGRPESEKSKKQGSAEGDLGQHDADLQAWNRYLEEMEAADGPGSPDGLRSGTPGLHPPEGGARRPS